MFKRDLRKKSRLGGKLLTGVLLIFLVMPKTLWCNPQGGQVVSGSATIEAPDSSTLNINQITSKAIINWESFGINYGELVQFIQPSSLAVALNRVTGGDPSFIFGTLQANGRLFLLNPNGILFGPSATVDVGGLVASTLSLSNEDFLNGHYSFAQDPEHPLSYVVNQGSIYSSGPVALIAPLVSNEGYISGSRVALGAGTKATLSLDEQGLINLELGAPPESPGDVVIDADALSEVLSSAVNNEQIVKAGAVEEGEDGKITLVASEGTLVHSGGISSNGTTLAATQGIGLLDSYLDASTGGVEISSGADTVLEFASVSTTSGDIHVNAGGNLSVYSSDVYAYNSSGSEEGDASKSGSVSLHAGGNLDVTYSTIYSEAYGYSGSGDSSSGAVSLSADASLNLDSSSVYSYATNYWGGSASAGPVSVSAGDGNLSMADSEVYSSAYAYGGTATAGNVSLSAGENVDFLFSYAYSDASGYYGEGDVTSGNVTVNAGENLSIEGYDIYSSAYGYSKTGNVSTGDVSLNAGGNLETSDYTSIYTDASAYYGDSGDTKAGDISLNAGKNLGLNDEDDGYTSITSDATSYYHDGDTRSGNISVSSEGELNSVEASIGSTAYAYGESGNSVSGDVGANAGGELNLYDSSLYSTAYAGGGESGSTQSGNIAVSAGGNLTVDPYSSVYSNGNGNLSFNSGGDMVLANVSTGGDVSATAGGSLTSSGGTAISANSATLSAGDGIGFEEDPFQTSVSGLSLEATSAGAAIYVNNDGSLSWLSVVTNNGNALVNFGDQSLSFLDSVLNADAEGTELTVGNTGGDLLVSSVNVGSENSASLFASGSILGVGEGTHVEAGSTSLEAGASIGASGNPLLLDTGLLQASASGGDAYLSTTGNMLIDTISALGLVSLSSPGSIQATGSQTAISGSAAQLSAGTGIGSADNPLHTQVGGLDAISTSNGISLVNSGDLALGTITAGGSVFLTAIGGSIFNGRTDSSPNLIAQATSTLSASGVVGTLSSPIRTEISNGALGVSAGGALDTTSGNLAGSANPILVSTNPPPPGRIFFNGVAVFDPFPPPPPAPSPEAPAPPAEPLAPATVQVVFLTPVEQLEANLASVSQTLETYFEVIAQANPIFFGPPPSGLPGSVTANVFGTTTESFIQPVTLMEFLLP